MAPIAFLLVSWLCVAVSAREQTVVLTRDHIARTTVVTGEDTGESMTASLLRTNVSRTISPSGVLQQAAADLAETLNDMAWIGDPRHTVGVVGETSEARTPSRILLGTAAIEEYDLHEEAASLSYPAYIYRTVGDDVLIFGATSKGTANGVYGFLQDELGVRWFGPQELFTVLPEPKQEGTVRVGEVDRKVEPSFTGRFSFANWLEQPAHSWRRRMRLAETRDNHVVRAVEPFSGRGHYLHHIVPFDEYFASNPEYFRMVGGERRPHSNPTHTNLCWTNPEVVELAVEAARERFGRGDYHHVLSLGITDADAYCECEECVALQPERYYRGRSRQLQRVASDMYFHFVNEVARQVAEDYPDRYLAVSAYNDVTAPPLGEVEDNVFVGLVLDISEHYDPEVRAEDMELVEAWEEKGVVMGLGYYTGLAKLVPSYFPRHLAETLKDLHRRGFRGLTVEATPGWWRNPLYYVDARLWWDVDLDVDELLQEYFTLLYGPAAAPMAELYDLFEEIHMRPRQGGFLYEHYNFDQFRPYTGEDLRRMQALIAQAHAAVEQLGSDRLGRTNLEERRLAYTTNSLRLFLDMLEGVVLARQLKQPVDASDAIDIMRNLEQLERLQTLLSRHEKVYREAIIADPYQAHRYTEDTAFALREAWRERLLNVMGKRLTALYETLAESDSDPRLSERLAAVIEGYSAFGLSHEALFRLGSGQWQLTGPNLVVNADFAAAMEEEPAVQLRRDWKPSEAAGWAYWQQMPQGRFGLSEDTARGGGRSGVAEGVGDGIFIGDAPGVKPGRFYYFETQARIVAEPEDGTGLRLRLDWMDADNQWVRDSFERQVTQFDDWVHVGGVIRAPENADRAVLLFHIKQLPAGSRIHFDEVSLREISMPQ